MNRRFSMSVLLIFLVSLTISLDVPVTYAAERGNFAGLVELGGGRKMYLKCSGRGAPTMAVSEYRYCFPGSCFGSAFQELRNRTKSGHVYLPRCHRSYWPGWSGNPEV